MYETYFYKLPPYNRQETSQLRYMDTFSFILSVITKDIIKHLKYLVDLFDFSNLNEHHELISNEEK